MVLAFTNALGGGIVRDVLMGAVPPSALRGWSYPTTAFAAGALAFVMQSYLQIPGTLLLTLDAAGLSLFAVAGTAKALDAGIHPLSAILLGTITGVGGSTISDLFLARVPGIFRFDIYASAALLGALVLVLARRSGTSPTIAAVCGGVGCFALRLVSLWQHWQLPGATGAP